MSNEEILASFLESAIREDVGDGDHSSLACIPPSAIGKVHLLVKEDGILAGVDIAHLIFKRLDNEVIFEKFIEDGTRVKKGDIAFKVEGRVLTLLQAERLVLNVMQRMSGIATKTNEYVRLLDGLHTRILDTRKTTPGLRLLEKAAVKIGGGVNHRIGLYDMVMLKDNHIDFAGGIEKAVNQVHHYLTSIGKPEMKIEVEVRNFAELDEVMRIGGIHRIMLDNFNIEETKRAVKQIAGKYETESSGGITMDTFRSYAECGVDFISVGALTHHIKSLDLSLKAIQ